MIKYCKNCKVHKFQDKTYGDKMRVMNPTSKKDPQVYRCTICQEECQ